MAWLEVRQSLPTHRKTLTAAAALDVNPEPLVGHLVCLWLWAIDNAPDGVLHAHAGVLARAAGWKADPEVFVRALIDAEYLDQVGDALCIHDWADYTGRLIDRRRANAERMKLARAAHVQRTSGARAGATQPDTTQQNTTQQNTTGPNQRKELTRSNSAAAKPPTANRLAKVIDRIKAAGISVQPTPRDTKAVKESTAEADLIAEAYCAAFRGAWGGEWLRSNLSLHLVVERLAGYEAHRNSAAHRNGHSNNGVSARTAGEFATYVSRP